MITKAAQDRKAFTKDLIFTKSARSAWELVINSVIADQGHANILLPAYIGITDREGSGIFDPVSSTGADFTFYDLNDDLGVNIASFEALISTKKFNIAFIVHYFGFCRSDLDRIKELCIINKVIFVEDCAHAFQLGLQREGLGILGDFSIYSVHKWLPVQSGGILKNKSRTLPLLDLPKKDDMILDSALGLLSADLEGIAERRRENFGFYIKKISDIQGIEVVYNTIRGNEVPQTFPIRVKAGLREKLYFHLMDKNIPTIALYYRLIDQLSKSSHARSHEFSSEILNLPVHQDVTDYDIDKIAAEIRMFLEG